VVARDILRKFPDKYTGMITDLVKKSDEYTEVEAKSAFIWIVGEYAERVPEAVSIIESYKSQFFEDPDAVKLQLVTAAVKLYLKKPEESEALI
jgi:vesicle coat complex subunit